jgi:3-deoxy-D-manno-octulosonate 8-phosphate phosphatase KdsC-like HAD superfamily phosphatase
VRAAEQLPLQSLETFAKMKDGQAMLVPAANGVQVVVLAGSRSQPVTEEQARPAIEQFILNERKRKLIEDDVKAMRAAAKIEYVGKFGEAAASAPASAPVASAPAEAPTAPPVADPTAAPAPVAPAASGLSTTDISKGMGLK